jgi:HD-GYP domain-containing protein (c-di-GMP phosphodiesterase class II)
MNPPRATAAPSARYRTVPAPPTPAQPGTESPRATLADVLVGLSPALDLLEGHTAGHTARACCIGMRLGREVGVPAAQLHALYFALLLKDAGGSPTAARLAALFGADDQVVKPALRLGDWGSRLARAQVAWRLGARGTEAAPLTVRARTVARVAGQPDLMRELHEVRGARGADAVRQLGLPEESAAAIRSMEERWDGSGHPGGVAGEAIPLLARILHVAQCLDTVMAARGKDRAIDWLVARRGRWFDPALVDRVKGWRRDAAWWGLVWTAESDGEVVAMAPAGHTGTTEEDAIDRAAGVFAEIVDGKSPFTLGRSATVARHAEAIGWELGFHAGAMQLVRRAGLLHDIGNVTLSNRLLDRPDILTEPERQLVQAHPRHTFELLSKVDALAALAHLAASHHERLDGSGYPWGLQADMLTLPARVLAVADVLTALTSCTPWREGMPIERALEVLRGERGRRLDGDCVEAVERLVASGTIDAGAPQPGMAEHLAGMQPALAS